MYYCGDPFFPLWVCYDSQPWYMVVDIMVSVSRFQAVVTGRGIWSWHFVFEQSVCRWTAPRTHQFTCCWANLIVQVCCYFFPYFLWYLILTDILLFLIFYFIYYILLCKLFPGSLFYLIKLDICLSHWLPSIFTLYIIAITFPL